MHVTRPAELLKLLDEIAFLIENLQPVVPAIGNDETPL